MKRPPHPLTVCLQVQKGPVPFLQKRYFNFHLCLKKVPVFICCAWPEFLPRRCCHSATATRTAQREAPSEGNTRTAQDSRTLRSPSHPRQTGTAMKPRWTEMSSLVLEGENTGWEITQLLPVNHHLSLSRCSLEKCYCVMLHLYCEEKQWSNTSALKPSWGVCSLWNQAALWHLIPTNNQA